MKKTKKAILHFLIKLGILGIIIFILLHFVISIDICYNNEMYPNIKDGDLVVFLKVGNISFDDIVLYKDKTGKKHYGRIVSIKGETVSITKEDGLIVNEGTVYNMLPYKTEPQEGVKYPILLKDNEFFILGDKRDQAKDSRTFGPINKSQIIGKEVFLMRRRSF